MWGLSEPVKAEVAVAIANGQDPFRDAVAKLSVDQAEALLAFMDRMREARGLPAPEGQVIDVEATPVEGECKESTSDEIGSE